MNPSQNDLVNSKRKRLDEDIIDLHSEHMVEEPEDFEEEKLKKLKC